MLPQNLWQLILEEVAWNNLRDFLSCRKVCAAFYRASFNCTTAWLLLHGTASRRLVKIQYGNKARGTGIWVPALGERILRIDCNELLKTVPLHIQLFEQVLKRNARYFRKWLDREVRFLQQTEQDYALCKLRVHRAGDALSRTTAALVQFTRKPHKARIEFLNSKLPVIRNERVKK